MPGIEPYNVKYLSLIYTNDIVIKIATRRKNMVIFGTRALEKLMNTTFLLAVTVTKEQRSERKRKENDVLENPLAYGAILGDQSVLSLEYKQLE